MRESEARQLYHDRERSDGTRASVVGGCWRTSRRAIKRVAVSGASSAADDAHIPVYDCGASETICVTSSRWPMRASPERLNLLYQSIIRLRGAPEQDRFKIGVDRVESHRSPPPSIPSQEKMNRSISSDFGCEMATDAHNDYIYVQAGRRNLSAQCVRVFPAPDEWDGCGKNLNGISGNWRARYQQVELASSAIVIPSSIPR